MHYRVEFREITQDDLDKNCPFMPEDHEFDWGLMALAQDASWLEGVTEVRRDGSHAIVVTTNASFGEVKEQFIPLLQNHWARLRISSFDLNDGDQA